MMDSDKKKPTPNIHHYEDGTASVLRRATNYKKLRFYQRSDVLYQLTQIFCKRFFKQYGDRTVDQMVQAARSCKQNIVEGSEDGRSSMESEIKLLNIAKGSNSELLEDYLDYLKHTGLTLWQNGHPRYALMLEFCRQHYMYDDYKDLFPRMGAEELANMAICLCHQVDKAMAKYIERKDREFTTQGGIRERMTAARLGQRATQQELIASQQQQIEALQQEIARLQQEIARMNRLLDGRE